MRFLGLEITRSKAKALSAVPSNYGGGGSWFGVVRESFSGAWQANILADSARDVLAFSGVYSCVTVIASDVAKLRIKLIEENEEGICEEIESGSPFLPVLAKPNHYQTRIKFLEQWIVSKLLYGNAYALKVRDARGIVTDLYILDARRVKPLIAEDGSVFYQLSADYLSGLEDTIVVPAREIIHDMMVSLFHPLVGVSPIYACGISATQGRRIQSNSTKFFANMSRPSGIVSGPGVIDDVTAARLKKEWEENYSGGQMGRTAVMGDGLKYEAMTIPAQEAQLIEQLKWTVDDVARCFHVPLFKIGGPVPVNNTIEALNQAYYSDCLQALIESFELCMDEGLNLPPGYYTELDLDGLLRMDMSSMIKSESEAVKGAIKTPNEARKRLNLAPLEGGDTAYMQQQNFALSDLAKRSALPNPFIIDKPTTNPTPSNAGPAVEADPAVSQQLAEEKAARVEVERRLEDERNRMNMEAAANAERIAAAESARVQAEAARVKLEDDAKAAAAAREQHDRDMADAFIQGLAALEPETVDA